MESWEDDMADSSGESDNGMINSSDEWNSSDEMKDDDMCEIFEIPEGDFKTVACPYEWDKLHALPADYIRREDLKIKDVAKKHVLPLLPAKSLVKFRAVSNEWNHWIVSPLLSYQQSTSFQKLSGYFYQTLDGIYQSHPKFLSLDCYSTGVPSPSLRFLPERVKVLSSSSGLLLCQGQENYYVCNPVTKDWKTIPPHQYYHGSDPPVVLAFDPQGNIDPIITLSLQSLFSVSQSSSLRFTLLNQILGSAPLQTV
ncbi:hypothetical protein P3S67_018698 [Capsicum chacoense]